MEWVTGPLGPMEGQPASHWDSDWATPTLRVGASEPLTALMEPVTDQQACSGALFIYLFSAVRLSAYARRIFFGKVLSVML